MSRRHTLIAAAHRRNAASDPNFVGWWKLNDASGSSAVDSASGNTGTLVNSPTWSTGPNSNGAITLASASDQYINLGNPSVLQITADLTITCWVKFTTLGGMLVAKDKDSGGRAYTLDGEQDGVTYRFRFYINGGGSANNSVFSTTAYATGTWYFVAATFNPSVALKMYVNGTLEATSSGSVGSIPSATANVLIGRREYSGFTNPLNGEMDDVRIYNRVLSSTEISALYTAGAQ